MTTISLPLVESYSGEGVITNNNITETHFKNSELNL